MAKKKTKSKMVKSPLADVAVKNQNMTPNQIADAQKLLAAIGNGKKRGLVFVVEIKDHRNSTQTTGCSYIGKVNQLDVARSVLTGFRIDKIAWLLAIKDELLGDRTPPHGHDEYGKCMI